MTIQQYSMEEYTKVLCAAVEAYYYPKVTYDFNDSDDTFEFNEKLDLKKDLSPKKALANIIYRFEGCRKRQHSNMSEVENLIRRQLLEPDDPRQVKDGLSNVLYWGYANQQFRQKNRVARFRFEIEFEQNKDKLCHFMKTVKKQQRAGLIKIKKIALPQFSGMPFVSKVRMFLDPENYPVLDEKIAGAYSNSDFFPPLRRLTYTKGKPLTITKNNEVAYEQWASWCRETAKKVNEYRDSPLKDLRAVDVERALFQLVQSDKRTAWRLLQGPA